MNLKTKIKELGLKQTDLAKLMGVSQSLMTAWLNEYSQISEENLKHLNHILEQLQGGNNETQG